MKTLLNTAAAALIATLATATLAKAETIWVPVENWSYSEVIYDIRIVPESDPDWGYNHAGYDGVWPDYIVDAWVDVWDSCYVDIWIETDWTVHEAYGVNICDAEAIIVSDGEAWIEYYSDAGWDF